MTAASRFPAPVWWLALLACGATTLASEDQKPETIRVERETEAAPADATAFVTILRAQDFESRVASVAELLQEAVGLRVRSFGGLGSFATVSIRGSTAEQVNIYIDGVRLNPALGGGVNLADLTLAGVETIEIYRGMSPPHLESEAIGGAINIRTRSPQGAGRQAAGSLSYGSYDTAEASALASWRSQRIDGVLTFDGSGSGGDFRYFDNNGTPFNAEDDGFRTRRNNSFWRGELLGRALFPLKGSDRVELETSLMRRRAGVPGVDAFQSLEATSEMSRALVKAGLRKDGLLDGALRLDLDLFYSQTSQRFTDRSGDTTRGGVSTDTRNRMDAAGPSLLIRWRQRAGPSNHYFSLLATARRETAGRTDELNPHPDRGGATRFAYGFGLEDEIHLAGGRVVFSPSARWSLSSSRFDIRTGLAGVNGGNERDAQLSGRLGAAWLPRPELKLRVNAGRFHRVPSFIELFGDQGSVKGSTGLLPEEGLNYDLGVTWEMRHMADEPRGSLSRLFLETALFRSDAENLIQFVQTSQSQVVARNTSRARVTGAEVSLGIELFDRLSGGLNHTWQVAQDRTSSRSLRGADLPGRPRHELSARASLRTGWGAPFYEFDYIGPNYFDRAAALASGGSGRNRDLFRAPGRYLHNIGLTAATGSRVQLTVELDNIFNVKTVDVARYPLPGRILQAKARVNLP